MIETILGFAMALYGLATGVHALLHKRDPRAAFGWTVTCLFVPGLGATAYWLFGVNRIRTRARQWQERGYFRAGGERACAEAAVDLEQLHALARSGEPAGALAGERSIRAETMSALLRISDRVTGRPLLRGNRVEPLHDGEQAYPAMLAAIGAAARSVYLCTYIFDSDATGRRFVDALGAAAERGVDVRVIVDAIGERYAWPRISRLLRRRPGVKVARFLPLTHGLGVNLRNHRKVLAVDGAVGFTGGMNIGQRHMVGDGTSRNAAADLHFRVTGPAVRALEDIFLEDWHFCTGEEPGAQRDEPAPEPAGTALCRAISDGPNQDLEVLMWILVGALGTAHDRVQIMTPYFLPTRELLSALNAAVLRGVRVDIVLPGKNNLPYVAWACQAMLEDVMQYGIRVHYQPPPFNHSKLFIVDAFYVVLGSANLDPRSLRLNFELNLEVYDAGLARDLAARFDEVLARSRQVTIAELRARSFPVKLRDAVAKVLTPYL